jgi:hypothetical protein
MSSGSTSSSSDGTMVGVVITPICKQFKPVVISNGQVVPAPDSKKDYNEQLERVARGESMCWDDNASNLSRAGDFFGFRFQDDRVDVYKITDVHSPMHRLPSWSDNVGQTNRNVLVLSPLVYAIPWSEWVNIGWHASGPLLGTQRMAKLENRAQFLRCIGQGPLQL